MESFIRLFSSNHLFYLLPTGKSPKFILFLDEKYNDYLKTWRRNGFNCYIFSQTNVFN